MAVVTRNCDSCHAAEVCIMFAVRQSPLWQIYGSVVTAVLTAHTLIVKYVYHLLL